MLLYGTPRRKVSPRDEIYCSVASCHLHGSLLSLLIERSFIQTQEKKDGALEMQACQEDSLHFVSVSFFFVSIPSYTPYSWVLLTPRGGGFNGFVSKTEPREVVLLDMRVREANAAPSRDMI